MVRDILRFSRLLYLLIVIFSTGGCNVDLSGLFVSTDLDERLKERGNFRFLNPDDLAPSFGDDYSFIVVGDTHIEDGDAHGFERLRGVIEGNKNIKFIVHLGDITQYGAGSDLDKFIEIADSFAVPCYPVIGNHDIYFGNWPEWRRRIGSTNYTIKWDGTTLFILDSANSFFGKEQLDRLEREISGELGRVFVFTHANLFVQGPASIQQITDTKERARIVSILRDRCESVFMGHLHHPIENIAGNVRYVNIDDFKGTGTYCIVMVSGGEVYYEFKKL
ncbi:MAG: metallophosphoesterase [Treponema sp.]|jgi:predicted phosphodiesterase|nr:metallophosphoesterase [Treponema sp.]